MSTNYHTQIPFAAAGNSAVLNAPLSELDQAITNIVNGVEPFVQLNYEAPTTLTLSGDIITISRSYHKVDTEGAASSDNLVTINGGVQGDVLYLQTVDNARDVVIVHGSGNIFLNSGQNITLDTTNKVIKLFCHGTIWADIGFGFSQFQTLVPRTVLGSSAANIDIQNVPGVYSHLELLLELRTDDSAGNNDDVRLRFNNDSTAANYNSATSNIHHSGVHTTNEYLGTDGAIRMDFVSANANAPSNSFGVLRVSLLGYAATGRNRAVHYDGFMPGSTSVSGEMIITFGGGMWLNIADAINRITLLPVNGTNFVTGSAYMLRAVL